MEWSERGYYGHPIPAVRKQYLEHSFYKIEDAGCYPKVHKPILDNVGPGHKLSPEHINGCHYYPLIRTISLEEFSDSEFDIIMPTVSSNQEPWLKLRNDLKPKAKLIREEGNPHGWTAFHPEYKNLMTSDLPALRMSSAPNKVFYHQKFDTDRVFVYQEPKHFDRITSFMPGFRGSPEIVAFTQSHDFGTMKFFDYGHLSPNGFLSPKERYATELSRAALVWHIKPGGDGFGHVMHNALAMGRPVVTKARDYMEGLLWPLLLDGKTCILIGDNPVENSEKIRSFQNPEKLMEMSHAAHDKFWAVVDYKGEEQMIKKFLERLV
jgi:hypothetical protein